MLCTTHGAGGVRSSRDGLQPFVRLPALSFLAIAASQVIAWLGGVLAVNGPLSAWAFPWKVFELCMMTALIVNGLRIRHWLSSQPRAALDVSNLTLSSLVLCVLGDVINRNFPNQFYAHDKSIEHSYLADSVWFFFPGYGLFVVAAWRASGHRLGGWTGLRLLPIAAMVGIMSFLDLAALTPGISTYVWLLTGAYTILISLMVPAGVWIFFAFHRTPAAALVSAGAILATVADAMIGHFWIFRHGQEPTLIPACPPIDLSSLLTFVFGADTFRESPMPTSSSISFRKR